MRRTSKHGPWILVGVVASASVCSATPAIAETYLGEGLIRGGVSTDASAIFTPPGDDTSTFYAGPDLAIAMPAGATVRSAYLVVAGQYFGFVDPAEVAASVRLNDVSLSDATLVEDVGGTLPYLLFDVTTGFGIDGAGAFSIEESAAAEDGVGSYVGITGHQLIVQWESPTAPYRFVEAWVGNAMSGQPVNLAAPPACSGTPGAILSVAIGWECDSEQDNVVSLTSGGETDVVSTFVGGGDDAGAPTPCDSNGAALYSAGSFGFDDDGPIGVDGDDYLSEPEVGRLSDELFVLAPPTYTLEDQAQISFTGDGNEAIHALVLAYGVGDDFDCDGDLNEDDLCPAIADESPSDLDADGIGDDCDADDDGDGVADGEDNCPTTSNADQADVDADGIGDACDSSGEGGGSGSGGSGAGGSGAGGSGAGGSTGSGGDGPGATTTGAGAGSSSGAGPSTSAGAGTTSSASTGSGAAVGAGGGAGADDVDAAASDDGCTVAAGRRGDLGALGLVFGALVAATRRRRRG